jgi:hypothetical protein
VLRGNLSWVSARVSPSGTRFRWPLTWSRCIFSLVLARWGIRILSSLVGIAVGIVLAVAVLSGFSASATAVVEATILFWIVHIVVSFLALRIFVRNPSISAALLLALAATIVSLIIVNIVVSGVAVDGVTNYLAAGLIIWICTAIADVIGTRMIRARRFG